MGASEKKENECTEPVKQDNERAEPVRHGGSNEQNFFHCPLPRDSDSLSWDESPLHHPFEWSSCLQAFALTISSFSYPAAIFVSA